MLINFDLKNPNLYKNGLIFYTNQTNCVTYDIFIPTRLTTMVSIDEIRIKERPCYLVNELQNQNVDKFRPQKTQICTKNGLIFDTNQTNCVTYDILIQTRLTAMVSIDEIRIVVYRTTAR